MRSGAALHRKEVSMPVRYKIAGSLSLLAIMVFMMLVIGYCGLARRLRSLRALAPAWFGPRIARP